MTLNFQKPFASPPTIFGSALVAAVVIGFFLPWSVLSWPFQLSLGPALITMGVFSIWKSIKDIESAGTTYDPYGVSTQLVTSGIYQYSRNPGYLGLALIQLGMAFLLDNMWIVLTDSLAVIVTTLFVIRLEERKLTNAFGDQYRSYLKSVRRWI